jgi:hypothetical protein
MGFRFGFAEFIVTVLALGAIAYGARYMVTQGLEIVVASQPKAVRPADTYPTFDWTGCDLGLGQSRAIVSKPCRWDPTPYTAPQPLLVPTMSKADSEKAAAWFSFAGLWPLAVGVVAALILLIIRGLAASATSRREFAALERLAELGPERDPFGGKRL